MKKSSVLAVALARRLPRGYWRVASFAAKRDTDLQHLRLPLRYVPDKYLVADLRQSVFMPLLREGQFAHQHGEDLLFMRLLKEGDVVFDVGASIGYTPLLFAELVGANGEVLAFEPSPKSFQLLVASTESTPVISCMNVALSDQTGSLQFYESPSLDLSSLETLPGVRPITVEVSTLDDVASTTGSEPSFVKIDVEGHESAVFRGMTETLGGPNPPVVIFESLSREARHRDIATLEELTKVPFSIHRISRYGGMVELDSMKGTSNYVMLPDNQRWRIAIVDGGRSSDEP